jgi:hypothetical protein
MCFLRDLEMTYAINAAKAQFSSIAGTGERNSEPEKCEMIVAYDLIIQTGLMAKHPLCSEIKHRHYDHEHYGEIYVS